jgi:DNA-binding CsgD family transcriptional regulator
VYDPNEKNESVVYIVSWKGHEDIVKIGRTISPSQRFNSFLTACHLPLVIHCICPESIMSEAHLHERHASQRLTLEHFTYSPDLKATVEMLNASTGFKGWIIPRTKKQSGTIDDIDTVEQLKVQMGIPPLRVSALERSVATLAALGMTVNETSEALGITPSAVKAHRGGILSKCFVPNLVAALSKLYVHDVIKLDDLTIS